MSPFLFVKKFIPNPISNKAEDFGLLEQNPGSFKTSFFLKHKTKGSLKINPATAGQNARPDLVGSHM